MYRDAKIVSDGPAQFASASADTSVEVVAPGNVFVDGGLHRDGGDFEMLVGVEEAPPLRADPPELEDRSLIDAGFAPHEILTFGG